MSCIQITQLSRIVIRHPSLLQQLVQTIADIGYTAPAPLQSVVIAAMLAGQDVIGQSRTGSGNPLPKFVNQLT